MGSEQESVGPRGFIEFPSLATSGLIRVDGVGSESSPMFTGLSASSCIHRRHLLKSQGFRVSRWCGCSNRPIREGQTAPKTYQIKSYAHHLVAYNPPDPLRSRISETRCSAVCYLRSSAQGLSPGAGSPRKVKTLKSPPIGRFYEFSRRAKL
jgi:hypothetical protein